MANQFKQTLRKKCLKLRQQLTSEDQKKASEKICQLAENLEIYKQSQHLALYQALGGEVDLTMLWHAATAAGKHCYFPIMDEETKTLLFLPATRDKSFIINRFGILEPSKKSMAICPMEKLDLFFLPLVAFDLRGTRLGRGVGYYDRSLAQAHSPLIGVGYELQYQAYIPAEPWDKPLDAVITQKKIYWSLR